MRQLVFLPGLDGTGRLLSAFLRAAPEGAKAAAVPLPLGLGDYRSLLEYLLHELDLQPSTVLVAESFSGPLAVALAARRPLAGLVLCNSFVRPPAPTVLRALAQPALFLRPPPAWLIRRYLLNGAKDPTMALAVQEAIRLVRPSVLADRLRAVLTVDAVPDLRRSRTPLLYLRGTEDRLVSPRGAAVVTDHAPVPVSVAPVQGPHLLLQVAPTECWSVIVRFVRELDAA